MYYTPLNTDFNRKTKITECQVQVIERKNGLVYFMLLANDDRRYAVCEDGVFERHFQPNKATVEETNSLPGGDVSQVKYLRYPFAFLK